MIDIRSYLRRDDGTFIPLDEVSLYDGDCAYVPGSIVMIVNGVEVLSQTLWTDVNWLWPFLINAFDSCRRTGCGETSFPDQPIKFAVKTVGSSGQLELTVSRSSADDISAVGSADEIYKAFAKAGLAAIKEFQRFCSSENSSDFGGIADRLRSWDSLS